MGWNPVTGIFGDPANLDQKTSKVASQVVSKASSDIFKGLDLGAWILRIGEIVLGVVLIGVGVAKLTGAENVVSSAVKTGVKVGAVA